jgi:hypothetical protein
VFFIVICVVPEIPSDNMFLYIKGPVVNDGVGGDYYIDDFSLVEQGLPAVDFSNIEKSSI